MKSILLFFTLLFFSYQSFPLEARTSNSFGNYQNSKQKTHKKIRHYINSAGQRVQSPTSYDRVPAGACAVCNDGTYSFSRNHRGTCSHHGGVRRWLH